MQEPSAVCEQVREEIDLMGQAELAEARPGGPIHAHVRQCAGCREHLRQALALASRLDQWEVPEPRRNIAAGVMAEVVRLERDRARCARPALLGVRLQIPALAAVAALLILAASVALNVALLRPPSTPVVTADGRAAAPRAEVAVAGTSETGPPVPAPVRVISVNQEPSDFVRSLMTRPQAVPSTLVIILGAPPILQEEFPVRPAARVPKSTF